MTTTARHIDNAICHYIDWELAHDLYYIRDNGPQLFSDCLNRAQAICEDLGINKIERLSDCQDVAMDYIRDSALSVEVRSGWHTACDQQLEPAEFRIVFSTGGPHLELRGDITEYGDATKTKMIASDWAERCTIMHTGEKEIDTEVIDWVASCFYFGD